MRIAAIVVLAGSLLVSSAQAGSGATGHRWQRTDLTPVTQPVAVDGAFVFYEASGRHLHLVALDARTGKTLWSKLASVSDLTQGAPLGLDHSGSKIIALLGRSTDSPVAVVSAVEAHSGKIVWSSPPGTFGTSPSRCPDERTVVCAAGSLENGHEAGRLRFDLATGKGLASVAVDGPGIREIGDDLFDSGSRNPDYLIAIDGARTAWRVPLAGIFGAGSSSDYGWNFDRLVKPRLFIGSVGFTPLKVTKTFEVVDLAKQVNAGFRISDGSLVWRDRGAILVCSLLPCAGQRNLATTARFVGLRLRMTGTLTVTFTETFTPSRDATATLEGFDPASGRTIWTFDAGHSIGLLTFQLQPPQTGATHRAANSQRQLRRSRSADGRAPRGCPDDTGVVPRLDHLPRVRPVPDGGSQVDGVRRASVGLSVRRRRLAYCDSGARAVLHRCRLDDERRRRLERHDRGDRGSRLVGAAPRRSIHAIAAETSNVLGW